MYGLKTQGLKMHSRAISMAASTLLTTMAAAHAVAATGTEEIPDGLRPPDGQVLALAARATGVQIYECKAAKEDPSQFSWALKAPVAAAIPWLLLRAKSTSGTGIFSAIASIQRLQTSGGSPPANGCDSSQSGKESRVPYTAVYRFYKAP